MDGQRILRCDASEMACNFLKLKMLFQDFCRLTQAAGRAWSSVLSIVQPGNWQRPPLAICLTGGESTGKTSLALALAEARQAPLVPEAARAWLAGHPRCSRNDLLAIAQEQLRLERAALARRSAMIVCDTDLLVIRIWWEVKFGAGHPWLEKQLASRTRRCYLLTAPDIPWQPDPLRETGGDPEQRAALHRRYRQALEADEHPFIELTGDAETRLNLARKQVARWLGDDRSRRLRDPVQQASGV